MNKKVIRIRHDDFDKQIANDKSFQNYGKILGLRGSNHAFVHKSKYYKAWYFPNFGNPWISYWEVSKDEFYKQECECD